MQQQNTNLALEIAAILFACLLAIIGAALLYIGKIDLNGALAIWGIAAGVFGLNLAFKAPSPGQQAQIGQQQQSLQQVISQFVGIIPGLVQVFQQQAQATPTVVVQPPVEISSPPQAPVQTKPPEPVQSQQQPIAPAPTVQAPQSVIPQRPQFVPNPVSVLPAVNLATANMVPNAPGANMATLTATPDLTMQPDQRNWNDSALIPVVQPTK